METKDIINSDNHLPVKIECWAFNRIKNCRIKVALESNKRLAVDCCKESNRDWGYDMASCNIPCRHHSKWKEGKKMMILKR